MIISDKTNICEGFTAQKMKFSIKDLLSKCEQIRSFLRIRSHLLKKFLMENFIFCVVIDIYGSAFLDKWENNICSILKTRHFLDIL